MALVGEAGGRRAPLTSPEYDAKEILGANIDTHLVYFQGTGKSVGFNVVLSA